MRLIFEVYHKSGYLSYLPLLHLLTPTPLLLKIFLASVRQITQMIFMVGSKQNVKKDFLCSKGINEFS